MIVQLLDGMTLVGCGTICWAARIEELQETTEVFVVNRQMPDLVFQVMEDVQLGLILSGVCTLPPNAGTVIGLACCVKGERTPWPGRIVGALAHLPLKTCSLSKHM